MNWEDVLSKEIQEPYFLELANKIKNIKLSEKVLPNLDNMFRAFELTPFEEIRVVIVGQDPYTGEEQANGLAFSVNEGQPIPPSLQNIFKELHSDLNIEIPKHGNLTKWAQQGVLLLNSVLTVTLNKTASHANMGWEKFTDKVIQEISKNKDKVIFVLWGKFAQSKLKLIDENKHVILKSVHPSPLSAHNGFFGSKHFSKINELLDKPIDWSL